MSSARPFGEYADLFAANALPAWYYFAVTAATLIPIIKEPSVNPAHAPDARPVQMGNVETRIIGRAVTMHFHSDLADFYEPQQLGATTKGGLDVLVHLVRMHLEENPAHVCVKLDIRNMFNEIERAAIIRVFEENPRLRDMVPFLFAVHSPMSPVFYPDGKAADKSCAEGTRQGAPEAGHGASAAIQAPLKNADAALRATGGFARADFDDTYLCGEPAEVARVLVDFEAAIAEVGAELQRPKSAALLGAACVLPADFPVPVGVLRHTGPVPQHGQVIGYGIKVAGIPLGDPAFVAETIKRKGGKLEAKFGTVKAKLELEHGWQLFSLLRSCLRPTGDYFARLLLPTDAAPLMEQIDDLVTSTAAASFGQDTSPQGPLGPGAALLLRRQLELPKRMGGAGLRSLRQLSQTAGFVSAVLDALPKMADRRVNGQQAPGLAPWLSSVFGADAFDEGNERRRLAAFLQHGGRTAAEFRAAWERGAARAGAIPHDGAQPSDSPWDWPVEMAGLAGGSLQLMEKTQRALTFHCEKHEHSQLDLAIRALPPGNEQRAAWLNRGPTSLMWAQCVAQDQYINNNRTFHEVVASTLGLPSPACAPFVGSRVQHSGAPAYLDPYGHVLGALPLRGKARDIRHDEFVMQVAKDLNYCGIEARVEPRGMVNSWMTPAAFINMNNAEGARPLQGCIPDLLTREPPPGGGASQEQLYDLKVINQCKTRYPPNQTAWCGPVSKREAQIPTEYVNRLRSKDQAYHHTQPGQKGPMETALLSYGGCHGLVGGFYGEMSPNFDRLIKTAAAKGAELHAGKYGLTDGDMVRSVLANKIRTNWAMALARENAHVKLANIRWVRGAGFEEARYDTEADMHSRWNKERAEYRYANEEYRGARMGGFGGRHCK